MTTLQQTIWERFLTELATREDVTADHIKHLRQLAESGKKLKPDDLARIFSEPANSEVK